MDIENADLAMLSSFPSGRNTTRKNEAPSHSFPNKHLLDRSLVRQRSNSLRRVVGQRDGASFPGKSRQSLNLDGNTIGSGLLLGLGVGLDSLQEILTRSGGLDVLDSDVDALLDVSVPHLFVNDDTNRRLGDVVDNTSLAVVDLVGHTIHHMNQHHLPSIARRPSLELIRRIRRYTMRKPLWDRISYPF